MSDERTTSPDDLTQVLSAAAVPEPAPTPPAPPARYVTVWPHTLGDFERFDDAVASISPSGILTIHRVGDDPRHVPPVKGYAPGAWVTFEHVGDYTPPKRQPVEPVEAPVRLPDRTRLTDAERDHYAARQGGIQTDPDFRRQVAQKFPPPPQVVGTGSDTPPPGRRRGSEPRTYGPPTDPADAIGPEARRRAFAVLNGDQEGGGEQAPKASTGASTAPIGLPADPGFWDGGAEERPRRWWNRLADALRSAPTGDPSPDSEE